MYHFGPREICHVSMRLGQKAAPVASRDFKFGRLKGFGIEIYHGNLRVTP